VYLEPGNLAVKFTLRQLFTKDSLSASLVSGTVGGSCWDRTAVAHVLNLRCFCTPAELRRLHFQWGE